MLRTKLFAAFATIVLIVGVLSAFLGIRVIRHRIVQEAQNRVGLNLGSAWAVCGAKLDEIETIVRLIANKKLVEESAIAREWDNPEVQSRLEVIRTTFALDFLTVIAPDGQVVLRAAPPCHKGDYRAATPYVMAALRGENVKGLHVLSQAELGREGDGLAERALLALEDTRFARPRAKSEESRGLVMLAAAPIREGAQVLGAVYGGVLLNRNFQIVDRIKELVFKNQTYKGAPIGTATIFLEDCRIATTVTLPNGNRAIGTRASKDVADRVLDNAQPWIGPAFVVRDWYLSAYDPIRDLDGKVVGMLYVGVLQKPFTDVGRSLIVRYAMLLLLGLSFALWLAFVMAGRIANPIHQLVEASTVMHHGGRPEPVTIRGSCTEVDHLVDAFNEMARTLIRREESLRQANEQLAQTNQSLMLTNRNYMETLGFVSHELKNPLSTMLNYVYLLKGTLIGPLTEKQQKAVAVLDANLRRLVEMVRHYLNLSRIESGTLAPTFARVALLEEVVQPLLEALAPDFEARQIRVDNRLPADLALRGDANLLREVFENLLSNAVKYGREGGAITLSARLPGDDTAELAVRNEGEGIPPDKLTAIFEKFARLDTAATKRQRGTGLGLFITKTIVEAHGGRMAAASEPGQWAEFRFTLPLWREAAAPT